MKNFISSVFTLMTMSFAFAQSNFDVSTQVGLSNSATVDQTGAFNNNNLLQVGVSNSADIDQVGAFNANRTISLGVSNSVDVDQRGHQIII